MSKGTLVRVKNFNPQRVPVRAATALRAWDAGRRVYTVEMGGLGEDYEMAIQGLAFELIRALLPKKLEPFPTEIPEVRKKTLNILMDKVVTRCDKKPWGGFSGAQVCVAKNIACMYIRHGYRKALSKEKVSGRILKVSRKFLRPATLPHGNPTTRPSGPQT